MLEPAGATIKIYQTDPAPAAIDARNPGTRMIGFEVAVGAGAAQRIVVQLVPRDEKANAPAVTALAAW